MKLIVGLGNKGEEYEKTRHNIGFEFINFFSEKNKFLMNNKNKLANWGIKTIKGKKVILSKPLTYMNLSGEAVIFFKKKYKIELNNILIIHDDIDLPLFKIKIKKGGGSAGHKGIVSIIEKLKGDDFPRVRIGVGKPEVKTRVSEYVLSKFTDEEMQNFYKKFEIIDNFVKNFIFSGYEKAAGQFRDL